MFQAQPPPPAPPPPAPRLVHLPAGFHAAAAARRAAQELGALVIVEDELPTLPTPAEPISFKGLRLRAGHLLLPPGVWAPGALPVPVWMDPSVVRSGGNVVNRVYTFGGAGF